ncbi:MAG: SCO family protein [Sphingobacteriaceae bacterium]
MKLLPLLLIITLALIACESKQNKLPIYGNRETVTKEVNGKTVTDTVYQTIPVFQFLNQAGDSIGNKNLDGKIYVADFFFTSCPSICPVMQRNMLKVYDEFKGKPDFKLLSFTIDPKHDTIPVLKKYAEKIGAGADQWWFLLGRKEEVYQLAKDGYLVTAKEDKAAPGGLLHEGYFILVDQQRRIRGAYDGTDEKQVEKLIGDIHTLMLETPDKEE